MATGKKARVRSSWERFKDRLHGTVRPELADAQPHHVGELLPYEGFVEFEGCTFVLLSDGSVGMAWRLGLLGHEALTAAQLTNQMQAIVQALDAVSHDKVTCQLIWDSTPSARFTAPEYAEKPNTYAQRVMAERIAMIRGFADSEAAGELRCIRRQLWLTLRWQREGRLGLDQEVPGYFAGTPTSAMEKIAERLQQDLRECREAVTLLEEGLRTAGFVQITSGRCDAATFLQLVRSGLHSTAARERGWAAYNPEETVRSQAAVEFVTLTPSGIQLGDVDGDTLQVLSWGQKPVNAYEGMMAYLLQLPEPVRVVMTIRRCKDFTDLSNKEFMLKFALDAVGRRQYKEITETQTRLAHNEKAYWVSLHLVVRNTGCTLAEVKTRNAGQLVANRLRQWIGIPFVVESHAAPLIYRQCLPLGYSPRSGDYTRRERRVLTLELSKYLPMYSGFQGLETKSQLMLSRAGEPIYLSSRDSATSQHIAVLATSGGGKSFWMANYLVGDRALYPNSLDFILDNKTSYEVLARFIGEEGGFVLSKPPATFPNIFLGALDDDRLRVMVSILRSAIVLASPHAELTAEHSMILGDAIRLTFEATYVDAGTAFENGRLERRAAQNVHVPRLSEVCDKFPQVCQAKSIPVEYAAFLRAKLAPYCGSGPYASIFDREVDATAEAQTPAITLIDLDGVAEDPLLCTLAAQISISDILRQVKRKENVGKTGRLIVEEAGILGQRNPELVDFVQTAWKTFRKLNYTCIGLTNEVDDYRLKDAARTIWQVSPTKVILPMSPDERAKAASEDKVHGVPRLLASDHAIELIASLQKRDGIYSQGLGVGGVGAGTFTYAPTGFDYWLAASKGEEVRTVVGLAEAIGGPNKFWEAVSWLARNKSSGFRTNDKRVREITPEEVAQAVADVTTLVEEVAA
jgi:hypothetical protein